MADQTLPLNVSYEMKADDERQNCVGMESDEELQEREEEKWLGYPGMKRRPWD